MRTSVIAAGVVVALAVALAPACATKGFVRQSVGEVNEKVATLDKSLEETQERVRQDEQRVGEVDQKAQAADTRAGQAQQAANAANSAAHAAAEIGRKADAHAAAVETATRKLIFETALSEENGEFKFGSAGLPEPARQAIDTMVAKLKTGRQAMWVEIEGHTDNVGDARYNERLGLERAEAVKRYLYEKHQIPLHKMNAISYGEDKPVAPNTTPADRPALVPVPTRARSLLDALRWYVERAPDRVHIHLRNDDGTETPMTYGDLHARLDGDRRGITRPRNRTG